MSIKLYDESFINSLPPLFYSDPNAGVVALCRRDEASFNKLRSRIEAWYVQLDKRARNSLKPKLCSLDNELFTPTLFEIALAGYFKSRGWSFDYEPLMGGNKTPDFLVRINGNQYIIEVATVYDSAILQKQMTCIKKLEAWLNKKIESDYWIIIDYHCWPPENINLQAIKHELESLIAGTTGDIATYHINKLLNATIELSKASGGCRTNRIGGNSIPMVCGEAKSKIYETLLKKAKKYNKLNIPMIIVVCDPGNLIDLDDIDIQQAVYGSEIFICNPKNLSGAFTRKPDGLFTKLDLNKLPRHRYVSGVLVINRKFTNTDFWFPMRFYGNPYADIKVPVSIFPNIPRLIPTMNSKGMIKMIWHDENAPFLPLW